MGERHFQKGQESVGNLNEQAYVCTADWRIPLSDRGIVQAIDAGVRLSRITEGRKVFVYHSPYLRTCQTTGYMIPQLPAGSIIGVREEPRIAEQQFGNFQDIAEVQRAKAERHRFGRFFYRFPSGEAGLDVYSRVTSFLATVFRDSAQLAAEGHDLSNVSLLVVTHGLTLRLLLMRYFHMSVSEFEETRNPDNGFLAVMDRHESLCGQQQWYELSQATRDHLRLPMHRFLSFPKTCNKPGH